MRTDFLPDFVTRKDSDFAVPFIYGIFRSPLGVVRLVDRYGKVKEIDDVEYHPLVASWGALGASLTGFAPAFASPTTTVEVVNGADINGVRFSDFLPRFISTVDVEFYWAFQNPDDADDIVSALALKGNLNDRKLNGMLSVSVTATSQAERILSRDILLTIDDADAPDPAVRRPLPMAVNGADKVPAWIYGADRSKFAVTENFRPDGNGNPATIALLGPVYYRGAQIIEAETSAQNFPPEP